MTSSQVLYTLSFITCSAIIGILILLFYRAKKIFIDGIIPFIYALMFYDFIQLLSLLLLKTNVNEYYLSQSCRWSYYLKSSSDAGQCLTLIFIFALSRHHIKYFITHNHLPNPSHIQSRTLTFVCLLFIIYINNWITHVKVEKVHLVTLNETKHEIMVQELPISLHDMTQIETGSHQRFIDDLEKYSRVFETNRNIPNRQQIGNDKIIQNHKDGPPTVLIKFPYVDLLNPIKNRTKRHSNMIVQHEPEIFNENFNHNEHNNSYRINRCTYGQTNFNLTNLLSLIHSLSYSVLMLYYLISIYTFKISDSKFNYQRQFFDKRYSVGKRKSTEHRSEFKLLMNLKKFLNLIIYSHTICAFIRLVYVCSLTITLCFIQSPLQLLPIRTLFYSLFILSYLSIPLRMVSLFIYCFLNQFSAHIRSVFFYLFNTNLRFSWKLEKPTICFRLRLIPYSTDSKSSDHRANSLNPERSSPIMEESSFVLPQDLVVSHNESTCSYNCVTTSISVVPQQHPCESMRNASTIIKL